jgi:hypothetical protein
MSTASATSASISKSYSADGNIQAGSLVSLETGRTGYVQAANTGNAAQLLGIAVANNQSLLAVDPSSSTIQVATDGTATALVSNLNGSINVGDQIAVSPFNGVGMKAEAGSRTIGLAQTNFNSSTVGATSEKVTDNSGQSNSILVGYIRIGVSLGTANSTSSQANELQRLGRDLVGHPISTTRAIISLIVAIVTIIAIVTLIYASIYGSIISIGRNPLAKYVVLRTLASVLAMVLVIGGVAALTIYLLLR